MSIIKRRGSRVRSVARILAANPDLEEGEVICCELGQGRSRHRLIASLTRDHLGFEPDHHGRARIRDLKIGTRAFRNVIAHRALAKPTRDRDGI
jgi:hypothetical protein